MSARAAGLDHSDSCENVETRAAVSDMAFDSIAHQTSQGMRGSDSFGWLRRSASTIRKPSLAGSRLAVAASCARTTGLGSFVAR